MHNLVADPKLLVEKLKKEVERLKNELALATGQVAGVACQTITDPNACVYFWTIWPHRDGIAVFCLGGNSHAYIN